jgi:uncharacterized membrane protein YhiD involved in acid resistance
MNKLIDQLSLNFEDSISPLNYLAYIVLCAILLYILALVYQRYGQSISNRSQLAKVLMIVGLTTFIIISIVKSSLALSLGLVGALSIVRFRTAIKEPEELGYFFMAIAIGLGMGANQMITTLIGFALLMIIIILQHKSSSTPITQNLLITLTHSGEDKTNVTEKVAQIIEEHSKQVEVKRINHKGEIISLNFLIKVSSLEELNTINKEVLNFNPNTEITFIDNTL